ncbi:conserved repeat domain-containing protein [Nocardioides psychrotolerans]|uniref:Conserved repeat domain-containing protein n=1 Tax=Nocardioides psychrotolerans TaxID=1005945 RepID=A0A1I3GJK0_9ACTN|nr:conserved repeat domain-containing protein [Nocardioides psychrotolerans]
MLHSRRHKGLAVTVLAAGLAFTALQPGVSSRDVPAPAAQDGAVAAYGELPLAFEPNLGQVPDRYDFVSRGRGFGLAIDATGATLSLGTDSDQDFVRLAFTGADTSATSAALEPLSGKVNYLVGNDARAWHTGIATFARVSYDDVLPGVDVTYYGTNDGTLEYDFEVAPHADPASIRFGFPGAEGVVIQDRSLIITTAHGAVTQAAPVIYQRMAGLRVPVDGRFELRGDEVGFSVGAYDPRRPLVIDPTLTYSTYLGGANDEEGHGIAVDDAGSAYVTGVSYSTNFPTRSPLGPGSVVQDANGQGAGGTSGADVFVSKLNAAGTGLVYSTYLGGSGADSGAGVVVDRTGQAHVTGYTDSPNFPVQAAFQGALAPGSSPGGPTPTDAFVAKLDANGSALVYSTYLGGSGAELAQGIALDRAGRVYVTGSTSSTDFPTQAPLHGSSAGSYDAFVTRLDATGSTLDYSTYLGGSGTDHAYGIAVDPVGTAYVTGYTSSSNFPTQAPFQAARAGAFNAFVTKINDKGSGLVYSTYLGGSGSDVAYGVAVDASGAAYVTGHTTSTNFPLHAALQGSKAGSIDAFVTKLHPTGSALVYSTYLGGSDADYGRSIAVDAAGSAFVTGNTFSSGFPTQAALQPAKPFDAFVTSFNATGSALDFSTYLGGSGSDIGYGIAVDTDDVYVTGTTSSTNFPTGAPLQAANAGAHDAFVTKLTQPSSAAADLSLTKTDSPDPVNAGQILTYTITVQNAGAATATGVTISDPLPSGVTFASASAGCTHTSGTVTCGVPNLAPGASSQVEIRVTPNQAGVVSNTASVVANEADPFLTDNQDTERTTVQPPLPPCDGTAAAAVVTIQVANPNQTTYGTAGVDVIRGTQGNDTIVGLEGNDIICGLAGNDTIMGGDGADRLYGDSVYGGTGEDRVSGGAGPDRIYGNLGADLLLGDQGADKVFGNEGADKAYGGTGDDELSGFDADDQLIGGPGHDELSGGSGKDFMNGGDGNDKLYGNPGDDKLFGGVGSDKLYGESYYPNGTGNDLLNGGAGNDRIYGAPGNDTLFGHAGGDVLQGGDGNDRAYGGGDGDLLYGGASSDDLFGEAGNDRLYGEDGSDRLDGGPDGDLCAGGAGVDTGSLCEPFTQ